jgi:glycosyltransferase involved in cell wall biosynthesis
MPERKLDIIYIGPAYPYRGGLAAYNERLALQLINEGHKVKMITFTLQYPAFLFPGRSQFREGAPPEGITIERRLNSINPVNWILLGLELRRTKPDILMFKYWLPFMAPAFGTLARITGSNSHTKVICIFDNVVPHEKRPGDKLLTKYFTAAVHGAVTMSQSVLNDLLLIRNNIPVKLNPHPLFDNFGDPVNRNIALKNLGLDPAFTYMLFFGFIRSYKGLDLLLEAFAEKRFRNSRLKLIVAGEFYEDDKPYRNKVKEYNLEDDIVFFDRFINDNEVASFFSAADLVVQPYKSATQSGVTQIAYHFEKPMLITDVGGLKEIVTDGVCGYVVRPDPHVIADSISDFFDHGRREEFTHNVRLRKAAFSWDKMTASLIEVYNNIRPDDNKK